MNSGVAAESAAAPDAWFSRLPGFVCSALPDGRLEYVSPAILRYTGRPAESLRTDWLACLHPDDLVPVQEAWDQGVRGGDALEFECRVRRHDGANRRFRVTAQAHRSSAGQLARWCCVAWEVEDRAQIELALGARELRLRTILDTIPGSVWQVSRNGIEFLNQFATGYTGKRADELGDPGWMDVVHPDDVESFKAAWLDTVNAGAPLMIEFRLRRADGAYRWFRTVGSSVADEDGNVTGWIGIDIDIHEEKMAIQAVRANERSMIIETIPALVWRSTPLGHLDYINDRLVKYTGKTLQQFAQSGWADLTHPDDREAAHDALLACFRTGVPYAATYRMRDTQGTYRWFEVRADPLRDSNGQIEHWYGLHIDVDDRKRLEDALRLSQARLTRASQLATAGELSASIAHEVNQPLTAISANAHACQRWLAVVPPNLERARRGVENIIRDAENAGEVVSRIRALFKEAAPRKTLLQVNALIAEVRDSMEPEFDNRSIAVESLLEENLPAIWADKVQIHQVLHNLLQNGAEALSQTAADSRALSIRSRLDEGSVMVMVVDNGCGFDDAGKLFDAFFTTKDGGMGMGLAICRTIIESHGGRIWAAHNRPAGAIVAFSLPIGAPGSEPPLG